MTHSEEMQGESGEPRGWVVRLGSYLRIFGKPPSSGLSGTTAWDGRDALDRMIDVAKKREGEFGD